jgi:hypothetical protein
VKVFTTEGQTRILVTSPKFGLAEKCLGGVMANFNYQFD